MKFVTLGSTGLEVSNIGLGTWSMGGHWWGPADDKDAIETIEKALACGVNIFDTADVYGFGHSESLLGKVLECRRQDVILASKVGLRWNNKRKVRHDLSPAYITKAIDATLSRLKTDYLDIYQVHWPDPAVPVEATAEALQKCVESGKVRFLGLSNLPPEEMDEYRKFGRFDVCQPPLNMFERYAEVAMLPYCAAEGMGVLSYSPLCRGLLSCRFKDGDIISESVRKRDPLFYGKTFRKNTAIVGKLADLAAEYGRTASQLAVAWVLSHFAVTTALCGARRSAHIEENAHASDWQLAHETIRMVDEILATEV